MHAHERNVHGYNMVDDFSQNRSPVRVWIVTDRGVVVAELEHAAHRQRVRPPRTPRSARSSPHSLLIVHRCTLTLWTYPPPWPGHSIPSQLNLSVSS